jgi:hypothetical protein
MLFACAHARYLLKGRVSWENRNARKGGNKMAKTSIVIVPPKANIIDYDYVAFSFNNIFSQNDTFKIYRTNTGGRLNIPVKSTT